jgi:hypothetical protein
MTKPFNNSNYENPPPAYAPATPVVQQTSANVMNYSDNKQTEQDVICVPDAYVVAPAIFAPSHTSAYYEPVSTSPPTVTPVVVKNTHRTSNPPPNCNDGGQWGTLQYCGQKTCLMTCLGVYICGIFGLFLLTCPQDEKDAYCLNGRLYDAAGIDIGLARKKSFIPLKRR